jgi:hypothetical protein
MASTQSFEHRGAASCGPINVAYVEVNSEDIGNVGRYTLADGSAAFDVAVVFAANIDYDGTKAQLSLNENVQRTLDDRATIRALQKKGVKVTLAVLGNHQGAGFANFLSQRAAADFARQVTDTVRTYHLDGVDLDDEWAEYGKNGTGQPNADSIGWLISSLRHDMPNKIVSFYDIGPSSTTLNASSPRIGAKLTYSTNPYYGSYNAPLTPGLHRNRLAAAAVDLQTTSVSRITDLATRTVADHYGVYTTYNLSGGDHSDVVSAITTELYGQSAHYSSRITSGHAHPCRSILPGGNGRH